MRISDWSSDVCSSDLVVDRDQFQPAVGAFEDFADFLGDEGHEVDDLFRGSSELGAQPLVLHTDAHRTGVAMALAHHEDRKSVVSGKSVSVRVDLVGRRIIKKKKKRQK